MDQKATLKLHRDMIDKHEYKLEDIQQDLIDIKTRLGIKDMTNGQVVEYQKQMICAIDEEKLERKEQDSILRDDIRFIRNITWMIMVSVIIAIMIEIASFFAPKIMGAFF